MPNPATRAKAFELPPLILHPLARSAQSDILQAGSQAGLILSGVLPNQQDLAFESLEDMYYQGRLTEIRMVFYVGRDVERWANQAREVTSRDPELQHLYLQPGSFVRMLLDNPPPNVKAKLETWGVEDYRTIFLRSYGLGAIFSEAPTRDILTTSFLQHYTGFADQLFEARIRQEQPPALPSINWDFDLFASGEYVKRLESIWGQSDT